MKRPRLAEAPVVESEAPRKVLLVAVRLITPTSLQARFLTVAIPLLKPDRWMAMVPLKAPSAVPAPVGASRLWVRFTVSVALLLPEPKLGVIVGGVVEVRAVIVALNCSPALAKALPPPTSSGSVGAAVQAPTTEAAQGVT